MRAHASQTSKCSDREPPCHPRVPVGTLEHATLTSRSTKTTSLFTMASAMRTSAPCQRAGGVKGAARSCVHAPTRARRQQLQPCRLAGVAEVGRFFLQGMSASLSLSLSLEPVSQFSRQTTRERESATMQPITSSRSRCPLSQHTHTHKHPHKAETAAALSKLTNLDRVSILAEALPYMQKFAGKTIVVKYGGAAMKDPTLKVGVWGVCRRSCTRARVRRGASTAPKPSLPNLTSSSSSSNINQPEQTRRRASSPTSCCCGRSASAPCWCTAAGPRSTAGSRASASSPSSKTACA